MYLARDRVTAFQEQIHQLKHGNAASASSTMPNSSSTVLVRPAVLETAGNGADRDGRPPPRKMKGGTPDGGPPDSSGSEDEDEGDDKSPKPSRRKGKKDPPGGDPPGGDGSSNPGSAESSKADKSESEESVPARKVSEKIREADEVKLLPYPLIPGFRAWKNTVYQRITAASGRPDDKALEWA